MGLSFFLGFFGLGPYLGVRDMRNTYDTADATRISGLFESKSVSFLILAFFLYIVYGAYTGVAAIGFDKTISDFESLFSQQSLVHISTIDCVILSLAV